MEKCCDPTLIRSLKGHKQSIIALDLHPSCKYITSAGMDNIIFLWDLQKKAQPQRLIGHKSQIHDLKFSPNGSMIVSASNDQSLKFWDVDFTLNSKQITLIKAHNARIRGLSFSQDGLQLASCGDDKLIKVWSTVDRRLHYKLKEHENWVRHCEFSPVTSNMASCDDKYVKIWDLNQRKVIQSYKQHSGVIHQVKFHSLGNCLASSSHDKKIKLYDLRSQTVIQVYEGHTGPVKSINFHPNSPYLISSSDDNTTKIWNSQKGELQYTLYNHSNNTIFSRHGDYFICGGSQKCINVWKTGFYDSLKEKILCSEVPGQIKTKKNIEEPHSHKVSDWLRPQTPRKCKKQSDILTPETDDDPKQNLLYNHNQNCFQSKNPIKRQSGVKQTIEDNIKLPQILIKKLQRINNQLDFINKTTQILEARVLNNSQQLQRLMKLTGMQ